MTESPASLDEEIESGEEDLPEDDVERLHGSAVVVNNNQTVVHTGKSEYHDLIQSLNDDGYGVCVDLCGVDYLGNDTRSLPVTVTAERFEHSISTVCLRIGTFLGRSMGVLAACWIPHPMIDDLPEDQRSNRRILHYRKT